MKQTNYCSAESGPSGYFLEAIDANKTKFVWIVDSNLKVCFIEIEYVSYLSAINTYMYIHMYIVYRLFFVRHMCTRNLGRGSVINM